MSWEPVDHLSLIYREVPNGVGADGVGVKFPILPVNCSRLRLFQENRQKTKKNEEKRRKTKKSEEKRKKTKKRRKTKKRKNGKIPPTPSTPTPLRTSQIYRGLSGSPDPKPRKSPKKSLPGASGHGTPRESGNSLQKVSRSDFLGVSGQEGPRDPCEWSTGSQIWTPPSPQPNSVRALVSTVKCSDVGCNGMESKIMKPFP